MDWIEYEEIWINDKENTHRRACYPVLGCPGRYVYSAEKSDGDSVEEIVRRHHPDEFFHRQDSLFLRCGVCMQCIKKNDNCDRYNQYHFFRFKCAKTDMVYFLVTTFDKPWSEDEENWIFIPGKTFNIEIFNEKYLGGKYYRL